MLRRVLLVGALGMLVAVTGCTAAMPRTASPKPSSVTATASSSTAPTRATDSASGEQSFDQLAAIYRAHRAVFAEIARLTARDPYFAVWIPELPKDDERYGMPTHLSAKRKAAYIKLLSAIGGTHLGSGTGGEVDVTLGSAGLAIAGEDWGYIHSRRPLPGLSTPQEARSGGGTNGWCVYLGDGWYANVNRN